MHIAGYLLRDLVGELAVSPTCEDGEAILKRFGEAIGLPIAGVIHDIAKPYFSEDVDLSFRRQGWPEEVIEKWWKRKGPIKVAFYIRCRFTDLPFVIDLKRHSDRGSIDERELADALINNGLATLLGIPVHMPRSQIGILIFAGSHPAHEIEAIMPGSTPDLLALGRFAMKMVQGARMHMQNVEEELSRLTPREWDCLRLLAHGYRDLDIAEMQRIKNTTVRYHVENIVRKLGASNRTHAVALACQYGIVGPLTV